MKMRRKGFLAALLGLAAAPVLGKVKPKPKFPRYFMPTEWPAKTRLLVAECRGPKEVFNIAWKPPLPMARPLEPKRIGGRLVYDDADFRLADCEQKVREGEWREITAAEAEALLKSKPIRLSPALKEALVRVDFVRPEHPKFAPAFSDWLKKSVRGIRAQRRT